MVDRDHRAGYVNELSIVETGYVLVSEKPPVTPPAGPLRAEAARTASPTWLYMLDWTGAERWVIQLPFVIEQPGIDGGGGRVIASGKGRAAVKNGAVVWQQRFDGVVRTTAFGDGDLAVAVGVRCES